MLKEFFAARNFAGGLYRRHRPLYFDARFFFLSSIYILCLLAFCFACRLLSHFILLGVRHADRSPRSHHHRLAERCLRRCALVIAFFFENVLDSLFLKSWSWPRTSWNRSRFFFFFDVSQYYLQLVPTVYRLSNGATVHSNQYSATEHLKHVYSGKDKGFSG